MQKGEPLTTDSPNDIGTDVTALDGCIARTNRAREHLAELGRLTEDFRQDYHDAIVVELDGEPPYRFDLIVPQPFSVPAEEMPVCPIPDGIGIVIGEICYNLRA